MVESPPDLLESLERAIEEFHQIRKELRGELDATGPMQEEPSSANAPHQAGLGQ